MRYIIIFVVFFLVATVVHSQVLDDVNPLIIGGIPVKNEELPFAVQVTGVSDESRTLKCSGAILTDRAVITAAHCLVLAKNITVTYGDVKISKALKAEPKEIVVHEGFGGIVFNDIGIIFLKNPLRFRSKVRPVKIDQEAPKANMTLTAAGWGITSPNSPDTPDQLQKVALKVGTVELCKKEEPFFSGLDGPEICTAPTKGKSVCYGDHGGPLYTIKAGKKLLVGIWSRGSNGKGCAALITVYYILSSSKSRAPPNNNILSKEEYYNMTGRARAAFVVLARNSDIHGVRQSMQKMEDRFNRRYGYPWIFLNDVEFSEEFKEMTRAMTRAPVYYGLVPQEHWHVPPWIDKWKAAKAREEMKEKNIFQGNDLTYQQVLRYLAGFLYRHPLLQNYDYYWRIEPEVEFYCDLEYDPFVFMLKNDKKYGFTITMSEKEDTFKTLWERTRQYIDANRYNIPFNNSIEFISYDYGHNFNNCTFFSNFEIVDMSLWRNSAYENFFRHLDKAGGFFYERWSDSMVHTIAASLLLRLDQIHFFKDIGFRHKSLQ
ncbi:uncharacterized protein VTP21DRAFT_9015 [Calcarisporiella thermophila]|uniref:uncharacterized protein n=1 Tax=Calcarisporiella thermophila TaxID=911321 RepID=UPI0037441F5F